MAIPDYWIRLLKEVPDEEWDLGEMWRIMTDRLPGVKTVATPSRTTRPSWATRRWRSGLWTRRCTTAWTARRRAS